MLKTLTKAKREVIQHLAQKHRAVGILLQETHSTKDEQLQIPGFNIIAAIHHPKHGITTYMLDRMYRNVAQHRSTTMDCCVYRRSNDNKRVQASEHSFFNIAAAVHVYPAIYAGDFECQHTLLGYRNDTTDGTMLNNWASNLDLTLLYENRQPNSFCSGRWQTQTNPDLAFTTTNSVHTNCVHTNCVRPISTFSAPPIYNHTRRSHQTNSKCPNFALELPKSSLG